MENVGSRGPNAIISIGGPPHSGKSVLVAALFARLVTHFSQQVFLERACPDGEGRWSAEASPEHVQQLRKKQPFSAEFTRAKLRAVENLGRGYRLVLVDLGGKLEQDVLDFFARSTHCILLSRSAPDIAPWVQAARDAGCELLADMRSQHVRGPNGLLDVTARSQVQTASAPWTGTLANLDREGSPAPYQDALQAIADALAARFLVPFTGP